MTAASRPCQHEWEQNAACWYRGTYIEEWPYESCSKCGAFRNVAAAQPGTEG
jgi:hypothetical protein